MELVITLLNLLVLWVLLPQTFQVLVEDHRLGLVWELEDEPMILLVI